MTTEFLPSSNAATLSARCAASLRANGELLGAMLQDFSKAQLDSLDKLLAGGGFVGIETLLDRNGANKILLVGIEREGARLVLGQISTPSMLAPH